MAPLLSFLGYVLSWFWSMASARGWCGRGGDGRYAVLLLHGLLSCQDVDNRHSLLVPPGHLCVLPVLPMEDQKLVVQVRR